MNTAIKKHLNNTRMEKYIKKIVDTMPVVYTQESDWDAWNYYTGYYSFERLKSGFYIKVMIGEHPVSIRVQSYPKLYKFPRVTVRHEDRQREHRILYSKSSVKTLDWYNELKANYEKRKKEYEVSQNKKAENIRTNLIDEVFGKRNQKGE